MKTITLIATLLASTTVSAFSYPEKLIIDNQLLCTVFDSNGRYYCDELKPVQGQASNTLILDFDDMVKLNAKPVKGATL